MKRALGRNNGQSDSGSEKSAPVNPTPPRRRELEPAHKQRLEAFSFDNMWRRKSSIKDYSPRNSTVIQHKRKSTKEAVPVAKEEDEASEAHDSGVVADGKSTF